MSVSHTDVLDLALVLVTGLSVTFSVLVTAALIFKQCSVDHVKEADFDACCQLEYGSVAGCLFEFTLPGFASSEASPTTR